MLSTMQSHETSITPNNSQDTSASRIVIPSSPSARRTGHVRSASILSSSSSVSIPSRSSSVMMSPAAVPARNSSIVNSPSKGRIQTASRQGLPLTASDLADTIATLTLADKPVPSSAHALSQATAHSSLDVNPNASRDDHDDARTPQPPSGFFATPPLPSQASLTSAPARLSQEFGFRQADLLEIGDEIADAHDAVQIIQAHLFSIQEQRHGTKMSLDAARHAASDDVKSSPEGASLGGIDLSLMQLDEKLEALSRSMQQLEVRLAELHDPSSHSTDADACDTSIVDKEMSGWQARARRNSIGSIDSLASLDDMALPGFAPALTPRALRAKYDDLCAEWASVQEEADALKKELADDKYLDVFRSISTQAEGMMDSLEKAVSLCNRFVSQVQRDHLAGKLQRAAGAENDLEDDYDIQAKHDELVALTKTFGVKKSYYLPACQQVLHTLEKGCNERQTANGTVLRRLSDLRARWRTLRDELTKTERDLKRMEALFRRVRSDSSGSSITNDVASPATSVSSLPPLPSKLRTSASVQSGLGLGTPSRGSALSHRNTPSLSSSSSRTASGPGRLPSSSSTGSNLSSTPPAAGTPQRLRRISATAESLGLHSQSASTPPRAGIARQLEVPRSVPHLGGRPIGGSLSPSATDSPIRNRATSMANAATGAVEKGVLGRSPGARPISIISSRSAAATGRDGSDTPSRPPPSSFKSSWHDLDTPSSSHTRQTQPESTTRSHSQVAWPSGSSGADKDLDDSIEYLKFGVGSSPARPASSAGQYYRPPSAQGNVGDAKSRKRDSMIPRLAVRSSDATHTPSRPGSAMSQVSSSTPMQYMGASRLSMQTPEPAIVARAQRLSMYARAPSTGAAGTGVTPNKRASKPPPTRRNVALSSGRATPLSAAALASLPAAEPGSSLKRSSISNLRSLTSGRTTPTFSDNGSVGGMSTGTWYGPGRGVRGVSGAGSRIGSGSVAGSSYGATGAIEQYRPNPNDALDVEVAAICNGLGVALERIDAPLPRGVRLEEGPGKDNRAQYEIGGRKMACRLLELHRPAGSAGARAGTKAKKILVRVGGGWQDLEQWLLGRLSSI
ncbi:hypothetical protein EX895_002055 [Sporisorium graminicola]|uniref:GAR domain-containing protein n=1 Tax=Sporisorium graminicola TaxID=280036 RepID=A0A4U7KVT2_9BASI|nr:hypothetical protein EX895_002055 [Sporisorium graminicola]TKY88814.1 hypothetical protein EX895_002055 [Sporisorium graminicola]